jgi:hypothetical protein
MYERDGIYYAGEPDKPNELVVVRGVKPLDGHKLWLRFSTNEKKIFDVSPLLNFPAFKPLKDTAVFNEVYLDGETVVWNDGNIDIAPETLYEKGVAV